MKKWYVILAITLSAVLCAYQQKAGQESRAESMEEFMEKSIKESVEESNGAGITFSEVSEQKCLLLRKQNRQESRMRRFPMEKR